MQILVDSSGILTPLDNFAYIHCIGCQADERAIPGISFGPSELTWDKHDSTSIICTWYSYEGVCA